MKNGAQDQNISWPSFMGESEIEEKWRNFVRECRKLDGDEEFEV